MNTQTISMTSTQVRKLLKTVPDSAQVCLSSTRVTISAVRKGETVPETVIEAKRVKGEMWEVTARVGMLKTV